MQFLTRHGWFSVVSAGPATDAVALRARLRRHLADLLADSGLKARILVTPRRDYPVRAILPIHDWERLAVWLARLAASTKNVKASIADKHGHDDALYHFAMKTWTLGLDLERGGKSRRQTPQWDRTDPRGEG
jgi:hypothetical protein